MDELITHRLPASLSTPIRCDIAGAVEPLRGHHLILVNTEGSFLGAMAWGDLVFVGGIAFVEWVPEYEFWREHFTAVAVSAVHRWPAACAFVID